MGRRGALKEVSDGYALNYLIPRGLAEQATTEKIKLHQVREQADALSTAEREREWGQNAKKIEGVHITIAAKANESGHLYRQLSAELIVEGIRNDLGITVPPEAIALNSPIKSVGDTTVQLRFGKFSANFTVTVIQASK